MSKYTLGLISLALFTLLASLSVLGVIYVQKTKFATMYAGLLGILSIATVSCLTISLT